MIAAEKAGNPHMQNLLIGNKFDPMGKSKRGAEIHFDFHCTSKTHT